MNDPKLEQYLSLLDRALGQIPVGDRSDIITEIKSHVLEAIDRDPTQEVSKILAALGEPENVANRYLLERGIKPGKPSKSPIAKWLTIGFLGTFGISVLFCLIILWKFTPLIKVDEQAGRVIILGGLIDIRDTAINGSSISIGHEEAREFNGHAKTDAKTKLIDITLSNGKITLAPAIDGEFSWKCKIKGAKDSAAFNQDAATLSLNLSKTGGGYCELKIPAGVPAKVDASNGKIHVDGIHSNLDLKVGNGNIRITPDPARSYRYETEVQNGKNGPFTSSDAKDALLVKAQVVNGMIKMGKAED